MTFSISVMWLHRLKLWNTMPSLERMRSICRRSAGTVWPWPSVFSLISSPLTRMMPLVGFSRQLMQRSSVDLPEPEPPMMATTSPSRADSDTPLSTCSWPNFLCRFSMWIASAAPSLPVAAAGRGRRHHAVAPRACPRRLAIARHYPVTTRPPPRLRWTARRPPSTAPSPLAGQMPRCLLASRDRSGGGRDERPADILRRRSRWQRR